MENEIETMIMENHMDKKMDNEMEAGNMLIIEYNRV